MGFFKRVKTIEYAMPKGYKYMAWIENLLNEPNTLIAGAAGSGKSVLLQSFIYTFCLLKAPLKSCEMGGELWLADPKMVELEEWKCLPHTTHYADTHEGILSMMDELIEEMDNRFIFMKKHGMKKWEGHQIYLLIDELGDLMVSSKKAFTQKLAKLTNKSRAAGIHVIACTQSPSRITLPAESMINFGSVVGLRCRSAIESRQVIGEKGCESLPRYGIGYYLSPNGLKRVSIPMTDPELIADIKDYWNNKKRNMMKKRRF